MVEGTLTCGGMQRGVVGRIRSYPTEGVEARVQSRCGMRRRRGVVDCGGDGGGSER